MRLPSVILLLALAPLPTHGTTETPCNLDAPWDHTRELLAKEIEDPEFVPVESVDDGQLLTAVSQWLRARLEEDVETLERLTISLPVQYRQVNREWIESELARLHIFEARAATAHVDPANPLHVTVLSEVAIRLEGKCRVSSLGLRWVKLNGRWKTFPGGVTLN
jgi:hypothetical protein